MSNLRAVLDRINDIEATISRIELESNGDLPLSTQLSLQSLESRRDMLREELAVFGSKLTSLRGVVGE